MYFRFFPQILAIFAPRSYLRMIIILYEKAGFAVKTITMLMEFEKVSEKVYSVEVNTTEES